MKFSIKDLFSKYDQIRSFLHFREVFFTFFQLHKWYETAQTITYPITYQLIPAFSPTRRESIAVVRVFCFALTEAVAQRCSVKKV